MNQGKASLKKTYAFRNKKKHIDLSKSGWLKETGFTFHTGSREGNDENIRQNCRNLGRTAVAEGYNEEHYGDGDSGTMGITAKALIEAGASVYGHTLPFFISAQGPSLEGSAGHKVYRDMYHRMRGMRKHSGAAIGLNGGFGTAEEKLEWITSSNGRFHPFVTLNYDGYWNGVLEVINNAVEYKFNGKSLTERFKVATNVDEIFSILEEYDARPAIADTNHHILDNRSIDDKIDDYIITTKHAIVVKPAPVEVLGRVFSRLTSYDISNVPGQTLFTDQDRIIRPLIFANTAEYANYYDGIYIQKEQIFEKEFAPRERDVFFAEMTEPTPSIKMALEIAYDLDQKHPIYPEHLKSVHAEALNKKKLEEQNQIDPDVDLHLTP